MMNSRTVFRIALTLALVAQDAVGQTVTKAATADVMYTGLQRYIDIREDRPLVHDDVANYASALDVGFIVGNFQGAIGTQQFGGKKVICPDSPPSALALVRITMSFIDSHPKSRSMDRAVVAYAALMDAFPCPK